MNVTNVKIMVYKIEFHEDIFRGNVKTSNMGTHRIAATSRKKVFEILQNIDQIRNAYRKLLLRTNERVVCSDIMVFEPKYEKINGKRKKVGMNTYTKDHYMHTYCSVCGRMLTDPISVKRGIGPVCFRKM